MMNKTLCTIKFGTTMTNQLVRLPELDFNFLLYGLHKQNPILTRLSNSLTALWHSSLSSRKSNSTLLLFLWWTHSLFHAKHEDPMGLMLKAVYSFFIFRLSSCHMMLCFPPIWKPWLTLSYQIVLFIFSLPCYWDRMPMRSIVLNPPSVIMASVCSVGR